MWHSILSPNSCDDLYLPFCLILILFPHLRSSISGMLERERELSACFTRIFLVQGSSLNRSKGTFKHLFRSKGTFCIRLPELISLELKSQILFCFSDHFIHRYSGVKPYTHTEATVTRNQIERSTNNEG